MPLRRGTLNWESRILRIHSFSLAAALACTLPIAASAQEEAASVLRYAADDGHWHEVYFKARQATVASARAQALSLCRAEQRRLGAGSVLSSRDRCEPATLEQFAAAQRAVAAQVAQSGSVSPDRSPR